MSAQPEPQRFREDVRIARAPAAQDPHEKVFTWPHLLSIELVGALVFTAALCLMSILVNAPLEVMANPQQTPNPSKAPWYFLGLQELLLHMNPSLAGVIVPTAVLVGLAVVPYIDKQRRGIGIYWSTPRGAALFVQSMIYTTIWILALVFFDNYFGLRPFFESFTGSKGQALIDACNAMISHGQWQYQTECGALLVRHFLGIPDAFSLGDVWTSWLFPIAYMVAIPWMTIILQRRRYGRLETREVMLSLYGYFFAAFWVLIVIGTAFRGEGMKLVWPWMIPPNVNM
jgi:menaquinol-cytochrome c reductase cytochrome b/c subunit